MNEAGGSRGYFVLGWAAVATVGLGIVAAVAFAAVTTSKDEFALGNGEDQTLTASCAAGEAVSGGFDGPGFDPIGTEGPYVQTFHVEGVGGGQVVGPGIQRQPGDWGLHRLRLLPGGRLRPERAHRDGVDPGRRARIGRRRLRPRREGGLRGLRAGRGGLQHRPVRLPVRVAAPRPEHLEGVGVEQRRRLA